jgi:hypothetical protein
MDKHGEGQGKEKSQGREHDGRIEAHRKAPKNQRRIKRGMRSRARAARIKGSPMSRVRFTFPDRLTVISASWSRAKASEKALPDGAAT